MKKFKPIVFVAIVASVLSGCYVDDYKKIDTIRIEPISPSYGFPLVNSTVSIADLLQAVDSSDFVEVRDDRIFLKFSQEMDFNVDLNSFEVPDKEFSGTLPVLPSTESYDYYYPDYATIENESQIKSIKLKGGNLTIGFQRDFIDDDVSIRLVLHSLTNTQNPDSIEITPDWSSNPYESETSIDLADAVLNLSFEDPDSPGEMLYNTFSYAIELSSTGATTGEVITNISFSSIEFEKFTGLIRYELEMPTQELDLEAFSSVIDGEIYLKNPSLGLNLGTSFGVPSSIEISQIKFANSNNEMLLENVGTPQENTFLLGAGNKNFLPFATSENPWVNQSYILNADNSNIDQILPFAPNKVFLDGKFLLGDTDATHDDPHDFFVNDTSTFNLNLDIEVPLEGSIEGLTFSYDMYDISFPRIDDLFETQPESDINFDVELIDYSVEVLMKTTNEIPMNFGLQAVFSDRGTIIDSLFNDVMAENIILSPTIDSQGNPIEPSEKRTSVKLTKEKYSEIAQANKLQLILHLDTGTEEQPEVLFKASQQLGVQISIKFDLEIGSGVQ